jgi:hypothetical protein
VRWIGEPADEPEVTIQVPSGLLDGRQDQHGRIVDGRRIATRFGPGIGPICL